MLYFRIHPLNKKKNFLLLYLLVVTLFSACSSSDSEYKERTVAEIYNHAYELLKQDEFTLAAKEFNEVDRQHPYSPWAKKAQLMAAYSFFEAQKYNDAIDNLDIFIQLHPGYKDIDYAYYLLAMCYYEQIPTIDRDQKITKKARDSFNELIRRHPKSKYARDAKVKLDLVIDHLAGHEMEIGRYYQIIWNNLAAMNRFKRVVSHYETTSHTPEALYRLVEVSLALGMPEEAQMAAAILNHNFQDSYWYRIAYDRLQQYAKSKAYNGFSFEEQVANENS